MVDKLTPEQLQKMFNDWKEYGLADLENTGKHLESHIAALEEENARFHLGLHFIADGDPDFYGWFAREILANRMDKVQFNIDQWQKRKGADNHEPQ